MKSMLGLLAAISMSSAIGGAVPNLLVTNYQVSNRIINPLKSPDDKIESDIDGSNWTYHHLYITPETFEDIAHLHHRLNDSEEFVEELFHKMKDEFTNYRDDEGGYQIANAMRNSWDKIYDVYKNSSKRNRLKLNFEEVYGNWALKTTLQNVEIDSNTFENAYFRNLNTVFGGDLIEEGNASIGITKDDSWSSIWYHLKEEKYTALKNVQDGDLIELESITPYSYFTQGYVVKLNVRSSATILSLGVIPKDFVLNTEENFDKINSIIENDSDVQQWKSHLADFNKRVERQIKEDIPQFSEAEKRTWKDTNAEIMKSYIRDWGIIERLLFDELKIEELKSSIDKIQQDLDNLKQEIKNIQQKIEDILNGKGGSPCKGFDVASKVTKFIPEVGAIFSGMFKVMDIVCKIQSA